MKILKNVLLGFILCFVVFTATSCISIAEIEYIEFENQPKEMYIANNGPDLKEIKVKIVKKDSTFEILSIDNPKIIVSGLDFVLCGKHTATIKYEGFTISADYYVVQEIKNELTGFNAGGVYGLEGKVYELSSTLEIDDYSLYGQSGTIFMNNPEKISLNLIKIKSGILENVEITSHYMIGEGANKDISGVTFLESNKVSYLNNCYLHNLRSGITENNNTGKVNILNCVISDNRTGVLVNNIEGYLNMSGNKVIANKTFGLLFGNKNYTGDQNNSLYTSSEIINSKINIKKNVFADNWYAQVELRLNCDTESSAQKIDLSQNYFGTNGPNIINDACANETFHILEGGVLSSRPIEDRNGNIYAPTNTSGVTGSNRNNLYIASCGIVLNSYYTDYECINLVNVD